MASGTDPNKDDGGLKDMEVEQHSSSAVEKLAANAKNSQLPWVEKYRPDK